MKVLFFPHDQKFWLDHGLFMFFLMATQMVITIPFHSFVPVLLFADLFWFPLFTLAVLIFRYMFKTLQWDLLSSKQFVEYGIVFSLLGGLAISLIMSVIVSSFGLKLLTILLPHSTTHYSSAINGLHYGQLDSNNYFHIRMVISL